MADVQLEHGFTQLANQLLEALCRTRMPGRHHNVMLAMIRLLYGYHKPSDRVPISQVAKLTTIDERSVRRVLDELAEWRLLTRTTAIGRATVWAIQKDFSQWSTPGVDALGTPGVETRGVAARGHAQNPGRSCPDSPGVDALGTQGVAAPLQRNLKENLERNVDAPVGSTDSTALERGSMRSNRKPRSKRSRPPQSAQPSLMKTARVLPTEPTALKRVLVDELGKYGPGPYHAEKRERELWLDAELPRMEAWCVEPSEKPRSLATAVHSFWRNYCDRADREGETRRWKTEAEDEQIAARAQAYLRSRDHEFEARTQSATADSDEFPIESVG